MRTAKPGIKTRPGCFPHRPAQPVRVLTRPARLSALLWGGLLLPGLLLPGLVGCFLSEGKLESDVARALQARTRDLPQLDMAARSRTAPVDVESQMTQATQLAPKSETAPDKLALNIAELRRRTLANNLDLEVALWNPALAEAKVSEEEAKFDATISIGAAYKRTDLPELDSDLVQFTSDKDEVDKAVVKLTELEQQKEKLDLDLGVKVPLPTGGTVKVNSSFEESNKLEPLRFEQYVSALKFSFSQPLLRGAGWDVNVASIRLARLKAGMVTAKTKLTAIRILALAEKAYWRVYGARRALDVRQQQYELASNNLELVRRRAEEGLSPEIEIIRAELGVAKRLESLIVADTTLRLQQRELKRILNIENIELDSPTVIETLTEPQLLRYELTYDDLATAALANRMELLELELALARDALRIDVARNQTLPLFALDFEYGVLDRNGSFGTAWDSMWDFDKTTMGVGLRGEIPVTNRAREAKLRQALLGRMQRLATRDQRELAIRQDVYDALDVLNQNWQRILAARQSVLAAGVNYQAELTQFEEGLRTMREVLEALTSLGDSQLSEVKAIVGYQVAQIDLAYATGTLLGYARVGLDPLPLDLSRPAVE
jgi:outer membrane protein